MSSSSQWDEECDVMVAGSGAGGLTGALVAAARGERTLLIEKTEYFGGTTALSGGGIWLPNNPVELRAGVDDTPGKARDYVAATVGDRTPRALQHGFLTMGPELIAYLEQNPRFSFEWRPFPDYFPIDSGFPAGRSIYALSLPASEMGDLLDAVRPPLWPMTDELDGGRALVGRLLLAAVEAGATLRRNTKLERLVEQDGAVLGADVSREGLTTRIRARRGVLLACGGFENNDRMRRRYQGVVGTDWTLGSPGNTGDALRAGIEIGAATDLLEECWWSPGLLRPQGSAGFMIGIVGGIIVNAGGKRFANESRPYDQFAHEMLRGHATGVSHIPSYLITDRLLLDRYGIPGIPGGIAAGQPIEQDWFESGVLKRANTIADLANQIGVPASALAATVIEFNEFARRGIDEQFHRGDAPFDRFFGEPSDLPNACLKTIEHGPFYAATIVLADLGTKGGLVCDERARVLREDGTTIPGLYAAGNTMASWTGNVYPGPGCPIGSSMVFSFAAVQDMLTRNDVDEVRLRRSREDQLNG